MTLSNEQEARRTKPAELQTCHDEQIPERNHSLQHISNEQIRTENSQQRQLEKMKKVVLVYNVATLVLGAVVSVKVNGQGKKTFIATYALFNNNPMQLLY